MLYTGAAGFIAYSAGKHRHNMFPAAFLREKMTKQLWSFIFVRLPFQSFNNIIYEQISPGSVHRA